MPIIFAAISPHPPLLLPNIGSKEDKKEVKKTIKSLKFLGRKLKERKPDKIIISSPHQDWGFNVPLYFLISKIIPLKAGQNSKLQRKVWRQPRCFAQFKIQNYQNANNIINLSSLRTIYPVLTTFDSPKEHYRWGQNLYQLRIKDSKLKIALIASGDLSHCLKENGPYGFNSDGPKFDKDFIKALKEKNIEKILELDDLYPQAGECGLRSFCFLLGILEQAKINWKPEILSYQDPFGVGYLVVNFKL